MRLIRIGIRLQVPDQGVIAGGIGGTLVRKPFQLRKRRIGLLNRPGKQVGRIFRHLLLHGFLIAVIGNRGHAERWKQRHKKQDDKQFLP